MTPRPNRRPPPEDDFSLWTFAKLTFAWWSVLAVLMLAAASAWPDLRDSWRQGGPGERHWWHADAAYVKWHDTGSIKR